MNTHMSGTNTRTIASMVRVPPRSAKALMNQTAPSAASGHHVETRWKKYVIALGAADGWLNGVNGAVTPGRNRLPNEPIIMANAHAMITT